MSFGGGGSSSNDEMIRMQKEEAAKAEREKYNRDERLRAGRERIQAMFDVGGGDYKTAGSYGWRKAQGPKTITKRTWDAGGGRGRRNSEGYEYYAEPGWKTTQVANPNYVAAGWEKNKGVTKSVGGLADDFYSGFKQSIMDFYQPEVARQYEDAQSQNLFDLARRGLLRSSRAADAAGDLTREKAEADAQVVANAENQTAGLRGDINRAEQNALTLLQQTEDPTAAANAAQSEVNAITSRSPDFSALGQLFSSALNTAASYKQAQDAKKFYDSIPSRGAYESSGRGY